jgi:hypothetical protein
MADPERLVERAAEDSANEERTIRIDCPKAS